MANTSKRGAIVEKHASSKLGNGVAGQQLIEALALSLAIAPEGLDSVGKIQLNNVRQHLPAGNKTPLGTRDAILQNRHNTPSRNRSHMFVVRVI